MNVTSGGRTWCSATGCGSERLCLEGKKLDVVAITVNVAPGGRTWCSATGCGSERKNLDVVAITVNVASGGRTWCSATGCRIERLCRETELDVVAITANYCEPILLLYDLCGERWSHG